MTVASNVPVRRSVLRQVDRSSRPTVFQPIRDGRAIAVAVSRTSVVTT